MPYLGVWCLEPHYHFYLHFREKETEAKRGKVPGVRSQIWLVATPGLDLGSLALESMPLTIAIFLKKRIIMWCNKKYIDLCLWFLRELLKSLGFLVS